MLLDEIQRRPLHYFPVYTPRVFCKTRGHLLLLLPQRKASRVSCKLLLLLLFCWLFVRWREKQRSERRKDPAALVGPSIFSIDRPKPVARCWLLAVVDQVRNWIIFWCEIALLQQLRGTGARRALLVVVAANKSAHSQLGTERSNSPPFDHHTRRQQVFCRQVGKQEQEQEHGGAKRRRRLLALAGVCVCVCAYVCASGRQQTSGERHSFTL